jgi:2-dehydro-3-deoxyphosphogluconate aldolase/(4S)-4-hydroxy-2-oxoglutarate aldolase
MSSPAHAAAMRPIERIMRLAPVIPVLVVKDPAEARPLAQALVAGGLRALEVTLRTPAALEVISEMTLVEGAVVGAGTVLDEPQLDAALAAGAQFVVSPGLTTQLATAAVARAAPYLPGVATASDVMRGLELGLTHFKFFPAQANGGIEALRALCGPFSQARFCPTGGVTPQNAGGYLAVEQVLCVGGTWVVPSGTLDFRSIEAAAAAASRLGGPA